MKEIPRLRTFTALDKIRYTRGTPIKSNVVSTGPAKSFSMSRPGTWPAWIAVCKREPALGEREGISTLSETRKLFCDRRRSSTGSETERSCVLLCPAVLQCPRLQRGPRSLGSRPLKQRWACLVFSYLLERCGQDLD